MPRSCRGAIVTKILFGELMKNLEAELSQMAAQCHALEEAALIVVHRSSDDPAQQERLLISFQQLDGLAQSLNNLSKIAAEAGRSKLGKLPLSNDTIRQNNLTSLTDRLLGQNAGKGKPSEFLF